MLIYFTLVFILDTALCTYTINTVRFCAYKDHDANYGSKIRFEQVEDIYSMSTGQDFVINNPNNQETGQCVQTTHTHFGGDGSTKTYSKCFELFNDYNNVPCIYGSMYPIKGGVAVCRIDDGDDLERYIPCDHLDKLVYYQKFNKQKVKFIGYFSQKDKINNQVCIKFYNTNDVGQGFHITDFSKSDGLGPPIFQFYACGFKSNPAITKQTITIENETVTIAAGRVFTFDNTNSGVSTKFRIADEKVLQNSLTASLTEKTTNSLSSSVGSKHGFEIGVTTSAESGAFLFKAGVSVNVKTNHEWHSTDTVSSTEERANSNSKAQTVTSKTSISIEIEVPASKKYEVILKRKKTVRHGDYMIGFNGQDMKQGFKVQLDEIVGYDVKAL